MQDIEKESELRLLLQCIHKKGNAYYPSWFDCICLFLSLVCDCLFVVLLKPFSQLFLLLSLTIGGMIVACVKWRFCRARRTSGEAAGHEIRAGSERERAATNPGRRFLFLFFCTRISWPAASLVLVGRARQNRHGTQAKRKTTKLFSTSYIRSFVVHLQVSFTKLKVCLLDL